MLNGQVVKVIKFPGEYLHSDQGIASFTIEGGFTGDRNIDKAKALEYLKSKGYPKIPKGYVLHHDIVNGTFQIVNEDIHRLFSHYGGHYYNNLPE